MQTSSQTCWIFFYDIAFQIKVKFVCYKLESLSFFEKIYLFKNADIIIGLHGAGFVNTVFCKPGTKIIEIRSFLYSNTVYEKISNINNLNYHLIQTETLKESERINGDINLPLDKLDIILNEDGSVNNHQLPE